MGTCPSSDPVRPEQSFDDTIASVSPVYYTKDPVTVEDLVEAQVSWNHIILGTSPRFLEASSSPGFEHDSSLVWFYMIFYNRLFDIHPACRHLFTRSMPIQGKFLVKMITMALSQASNPERFQSIMEDLALNHCELGVRAIEYGIVGDVLFYSLHTVLGSAYTAASETAWRRIYSAMLTYILPAVVRYEAGAHKKRDCPLLYCDPTASSSAEKSGNRCPINTENDVDEKTDV